MRHFLLLLGLSVALAGCKTFEGQLTLHQPVQFKKKKLFSSKKKMVPAGHYAAKLEIESKTEAKIKIDGNKELRLEFPKNSLPSYQGRFEIPASQLNKPYHVKGNLDVDVTRSGEYNDYESCIYTEKVRRCREVEVGNGHDHVDCSQFKKERRRQRCRENNHHRHPRTRRVCEWVDESKFGDQAVSYYYEYTRSDLDVDLYNADVTELVAEFSGTHNETQKYYTYKGICH